MKLNVNGAEHNVDVEDDMPLLWVLRDTLGITGPKYGCGIAQCGACTVHMDALAVRACQVTAKTASGKSITTIEGLGTPEEPHPIQQAWIENQVAQCGYCQPGHIMATAVLLKFKPNPTDEDIDNFLSANLCRCGTYPRIREAVKSAAKKMQEL